MKHVDFSIDEVAMLRFLELCIPSLDPDNYENVLSACHARKHCSRWSERRQRTEVSEAIVR